MSGQPPEGVGATIAPGGAGRLCLPGLGGRLTRRGVHQRAIAAGAAGATGLMAQACLPGQAKAVPAVVPATLTPARRQPNVLLITVDTLRTDHAGPGGYLAARTPAMDRLAAEGVYADTWVQLPQTTPNHTTILTGTYVQTHGLRTTLWDKARSSIPTLDQVYHRAGYRTGAIVSWYSFDDRFTNLVRAWGTWEQYTVRFGTRDLVSPAETRQLFATGADMGRALDGDATVTTDAALRWLDTIGTLRDRPWFLWLHYRDPHYPFTPPAPFDMLPDTGASFDGSFDSMARIDDGYRPTPGEMARLLAAYDGEIAYTDSQVGRVLDRLDRLGLAQDTIVVLTGDHGESFLEHDDWLHGHSVYEPAVRVPTIIRYLARLDVVVPGMRLRPPVQSADLAPTMLELSGLPVLDTMEGRSLAPLLAGRKEEAGPPRAAWGTLYDDTQLFVVSGQWKLVRWNNPDVRAGDELYHLPSDPGETHNYVGEVPEVAAALGALLDRWLATKAAGQLWKPWA